LKNKAEDRKQKQTQRHTKFTKSNEQKNGKVRQQFGRIYRKVSGTVWRCGSQQSVDHAWNASSFTGSVQCALRPGRVWSESDWGDKLQLGVVSAEDASV
jgi:hypothetical protein